MLGRLLRRRRRSGHRRGNFGELLKDLLHQRLRVLRRARVRIVGEQVVEALPGADPGIDVGVVPGDEQLVHGEVLETLAEQVLGLRRVRGRGVELEHLAQALGRLAQRREVAEGALLLGERVPARHDLLLRLRAHLVEERLLVQLLVLAAGASRHCDDRGQGDQPSHPASSPRNRAIAADLSAVPKTAVPATRISAPRRCNSPALSDSTPPSTASSTPGALWSRMARKRASLSSTSGIRRWPPNPGSTDITRRKPTSGQTSSRAATGVAGLIATPGTAPSAWMRPRVRWRCVTASTCTAIRPAPATANGSTKSSAFVTIRWTSSGNSVSRRTAAHRPGPKVRLGTKCPSITSKWSRSAPAAATERTSSATRPRSHASSEGAMRTRLTGSPTARSRPPRPPARLRAGPAAARSRRRCPGRRPAAPLRAGTRGRG